MAGRPLGRLKTLESLIGCDLALLRRVSESRFSYLVRMEMESQGWLQFNLRRTATLTRSGGYQGLGPPGFPDIVAVRDDRLIFAELKTEDGVILPEQHNWLGSLDNIPCAEVYIWTPSDAESIILALAPA